MEITVWWFYFKVYNQQLAYKIFICKFLRAYENSSNILSHSKKAMQVAFTRSSWKYDGQTQKLIFTLTGMMHIL
jgi:hypothetical protein